MRFLATLFFAVSVSACSAYSERKGIFVAYNNSNDNVLAFVNDGEGHPVHANSSTKFIVSLQVPKNRVIPGYFGTPTGPSAVDKIVQVSIAFRNTATGKQTPHFMCQAGVKVITNISYEIDRWGYERTRCDPAYPYY